jgi:hypothetical protein
MLDIKIPPNDPVQALFAREGEKELAMAAEKYLVPVKPTMDRPMNQAATFGRRRANLTKNVAESPQGLPAARRAHRSLSKHSMQSVDSASVDSPSHRLSQAWQDACQLMRAFVFGFCGLRLDDATLDHTMGTKDLVRVLYSIWTRLDSDESGRVNLSEFRAFAAKHARERLGRWVLLHPTQGGLDAAVEKARGFESDDIDQLCTKVEQLLLTKKSSFSILDMMKLIWPAATFHDIQTMGQWCTELKAEAAKLKMEPPPILPKEELDGLMSIFEMVDVDKSNSVSFEELISAGIIHSEQEARYRKDWDHDGNGTLDLLEFCEMMCPAGFRAHADAQVALLMDGRLIVFDGLLNCWRVEQSEPITNLME